MNTTEKALMLDAVKRLCAAFGCEIAPDAEPAVKMAEGLGIVAAALMKNRQNLVALTQRAARHIEADPAGTDKNGGLTGQ
ncbi:MAG: hypothetical protein EOM20_20665 [Spartobacteria bacterium]|nr:hypothetical protein [Spartobacteria bacterium]